MIPINKELLVYKDLSTVIFKDMNWIFVNCVMKRHLHLKGMLFPLAKVS